jgi:hypothetical protein
MIGLGLVAILCTGPAAGCAALEAATLDAVAWWSGVEPAAELAATLDANADSAWTFTVEWCDDCYAVAYALPWQGRILIERNTFARTLPRYIAHEMGHIFGAHDQYPACQYGKTIMCTTFAWFTNSVSGETRQRIGWGELPVWRVYLPSLTVSGNVG